MSIGIMGRWVERVWFCLIDFLGDSATRNETEGIECVHGHAIKNKIKNHATDEVKRL